MQNLLFFSVCTHHRNAAGTLSVEPHVLRHRLGKHYAAVVGGKELDRVAVIHHVVTSVALVGRIEEHKVALLNAHLQDLLPLLLSGVNARRILATCLEQQDGAVRKGELKVDNHAFEVYSLGLLIIVSKFDLLEASVGDDVVVQAPSHVRDVDLLWASWIKSTQHFETNSQGAGATDGHGRSNSVLKDCGMLLSVGLLDGKLSETRVAVRERVLLFCFGIDQYLLSLLDGL